MTGLIDRRWIAIVFTVPALVVAGCGGGDDGGATDATSADVDDTTSGEEPTNVSNDATLDDVETPEETAGADEAAGNAGAPQTGEGGCTVDVTGDVTASWTGPDDVSSVGSDYWLNDDELREAYELFAADDDPSFDEAQATGEPVLAVLLMNCVGDDGNSISLYTSGSSGFDDVPRESGSYPISGDFDAPPATFEVVLAFNPDEEALFQPDDAGGSIELEEWTDGRLRGTFTFGIEESFVDIPRTATVTGTFDFTN